MCRHWNVIVIEVKNCPGNLDTRLSWHRGKNVGLGIGLGWITKLPKYQMETGMRNIAHQVLAQCLTQHLGQLCRSHEAVFGGPAALLLLCVTVLTLFVWK